ncbi:butyrophilin-like protein 3 isoform X1 [Oreochromis aureus]|uniref:butyrophilin-like protein 3 isoform X1 n=1 Tax=Oreochromis aureus TaxID=47969 RepID=UPI001954AF92|nr:butyrophilin-like protein 3 isoform X1 [Oreochromis aureus]
MCSGTSAMLFWILLFACLLLFVCTDPTEVNVEPGKDAILQCHHPADSEIAVLEWRRPEFESNEYVFFFRNGRAYENYQHESFKGRVELREPSMKDGDVSVTLKNLSVSDAGTYQCWILFSKSTDELKCLFKLNITASGVMDEEDKQMWRDKDRGDEDRSPSNIDDVSVCAVLLFIVIVILVVLMYIRQRNKAKYPPT